MKREKEKIVALNNYIHETSSSGCEIVKENAFIAGEDYIRHRQEQSRLCNEFITAFRRAMEGGAE